MAAAAVVVPKQPHLLNASTIADDIYTLITDELSKEVCDTDTYNKALSTLAVLMQLE